MVGITNDDDDANAATGDPRAREQARADAEKMKQRIADDKAKHNVEEQRKKLRRSMFAAIKKFTELHEAPAMDTKEASLFAKWIAWKKCGYESNEIPLKEVTTKTWLPPVFETVMQVLKEKQNYETAREMFMAHMKAHPEDAEA